MQLIGPLVLIKDSIFFLNLKFEIFYLCEKSFFFFCYAFILISMEFHQRVIIVEIQTVATWKPKF